MLALSAPSMAATLLHQGVLTSENGGVNGTNQYTTASSVAYTVSQNTDGSYNYSYEFVMNSFNVTYVMVEVGMDMSDQEILLLDNVSFSLGLEVGIETLSVPGRTPPLHGLKWGLQEQSTYAAFTMVTFNAPVEGVAYINGDSETYAFAQSSSLTGDTLMVPGSAIPEPGITFLSLIGLLILGRRRRT